MISLAQIEQIAQDAKASLKRLNIATEEQKNLVLQTMLEELETAKEELFLANTKDLEAGRAKGLSEEELQKITLTQTRIKNMQTSLQTVINSPDPIGKVRELNYLPNGMQLGKMQSPLGVVGVIYESQINTNIETASLALKAGNATILRCGEQVLNTNMALGNLWSKALQTAKLPETSVQIIPSSDTDAIAYLTSMKNFLELIIIPRGDKQEIENIVAQSQVPIMKNLAGNCHIYVDETADVENALDIIMNAKTQNYTACNTVETLLINQNIASGILNNLTNKLKEKGVEIRACEKAMDLLTEATPATEEDWFADYLAPTLAIKIVPNLDTAIDHINFYGSKHTDSILTNNYKNAQKFLRLVDSGSVMVNASPRLADGNQYGLGGEMFISTDKLHARGPVALQGLTTQKYVVLGQGQVRK